MIVLYLPRTIRSKLFKIVYCLEQIHAVWAFLKDEWKESWETYGWAFAFGDYASKLEYWGENANAFGEWIEKRAYRTARKRLLPH